MPRNKREVHMEGFKRNASRNAGMAASNLLCRWRVRPRRCHVSALGLVLTSSSYTFSAAARSPGEPPWLAGGEDDCASALAAVRTRMTAARTLEEQLQAHLNGTLIILRARAAPEVRCADGAPGIAEVGVIERVKSFSTVLQT